jgi:sigma-B regulation protein RsbU (phosphoserine phosphatase)
MTGGRLVVGHAHARGGAILRSRLAGLGFRDVHLAGDAMALLGAVHRSTDLVLLDQSLLGVPGGRGMSGGQGESGLRLLRRIRDSVGRRVPVLVLGRFPSVRQRAGMMEAGASDLIVRPVSLAELGARLHVYLENAGLNRSLGEVIRSLRNYHTGAAERMRLAREMQLALLPDDAQRRDIAARLGVGLDAHFESSSELGGDIWGVLSLDRRRLALFLCSFAGHGVTAALNTFRVHALLTRRDLPFDNPSAMLESLNRHLVEVLPEEQLATMIYAVADMTTDRLVYATAGASKPVLGLPDGTMRFGETSGQPLGQSADASYQNRVEPFLPGAFLFLFSDALHRSRDWEGRPFGYDGVGDLVRWALSAQRDGACHGETGLPALIDRFFAVMPRPLAEDLTGIWLTRRPG